MPDYNQHMAGHRRLNILNLLDNALVYTLNEVDVKAQLAALGQNVSTDTLRGDLQWLHEQGLVYAKHEAGIWVTTLTSRGGDVRMGLSEVPGVARPEPK
ncbi:MAG: hypothetical protein CTY18_06025 [Methylomonas sp.]|nr:MAG: hypothetical protein CTY24_11825 [Methylobacter sp.]PPD36031.1 MAG: hypothetical protein CTY18_06025 [Methylomonas sp.]